MIWVWPNNPYGPRLLTANGPQTNVRFFGQPPTVIAGPFYIDACEVFMPGAKAAEAFTYGAEQAGRFSSGAEERQPT